MSETLSPPDLREVFERFAIELPNTQRQLDAVYVDGLTRFARLFADASRAGYEGLARSLAPSRQTVREYSAVVDVHFVQSSEEERRIGVRIVNLGYLRRHAAAQFTRSRLRVRVTQAPFSPGARFER